MKKRPDGIVIPDNYETWEAMQRERHYEKRCAELETRIEVIEKLLQDKYND